MKYFQLKKSITIFVLLFSIIYISCDKNEEISSGKGTTTNQKNTNANLGNDLYVHRLEIPKLKGGDNNKFITYTTTFKGERVVTFSIEQNISIRHPWWSAFTFDASTAQDKNVGRTDYFTQDPNINSNWQSNNYDFGPGGNDGIDRGHLCASEDRQYSAEANAQTFYFTNMSPQYSNFNQKIWASLENKVQSWGRSYTSQTDTLFVTKGGTITKGMTITTESNVNIMPKYYYMALLSKKYDKKNKQFQYKAIAFWLEHKKEAYSTPYDFKKFAISIDELEEKTGIDFFCNLPDLLENAVEAKFDTSAWAGL